MTDRRDFIKALGAAAVGPTLWPLAPSPYHRAPSRKLDRVGLQLYTVRQAMEHDMEGTLAKVAEAGYGEVEFAGYFGHTPKEVRAMLEHHGLAAPSAHMASLAPDEWTASLDVAKAIGHEYIVVPWIPAEARKTLDGFKRVAQDFNRAAAQAHDAGLQFAYHNHDFEFARTEGRLPYDVLIAETDPKLVQFEIDLYWMVKGGQDPLAYFARLPGRRGHRRRSVGDDDHARVDRVADADATAVMHRDPARTCRGVHERVEDRPVRDRIA